MEATGCSETSVPIFQTTCHHIWEDCNRNAHQCKKPRFHISPNSEQSIPASFTVTVELACDAGAINMLASYWLPAEFPQCLLHAAEQQAVRESVQKHTKRSNIATLSGGHLQQIVSRIRMTSTLWPRLSTCTGVCIRNPVIQTTSRVWWGACPDIVLTGTSVRLTMFPSVTHVPRNVKRPMIFWLRWFTSP
jgi:hypothetical protein